MDMKAAYYESEFFIYKYQNEVSQSLIQSLVEKNNETDDRRKISLTSTSFSSNCNSSRRTT